VAAVRQIGYATAQTARGLDAQALIEPRDQFSAGPGRLLTRSRVSWCSSRALSQNSPGWQSPFGAV